jgi:hypothetical protein
VPQFEKLTHYRNAEPRCHASLPLESAQDWWANESHCAKLLVHLNLVSNNLAALVECALRSYRQSNVQVLARTLRSIFEPGIRLIVVAHVENDVLLGANGQLALTLLGDFAFQREVGL